MSAYLQSSGTLLFRITIVLYTAAAWCITPFNIFKDIDTLLISVCKLEDKNTVYPDQHIVSWQR